MYIHSCILNVSFPNNLDELKNMLIKNRDNGFCEEDTLDIELLINYQKTFDICWTMPKSMNTGDIILFFHAKYAFKKIRLIIKEAKLCSEYNGYIKDVLDKAEKYYDKFGGKIFSIARVGAKPEHMNNNASLYHFGGRIFGDVEDVYLLDNPISLDKFSNFILISRQSSITPIYGDNYEKIKKIIIENNVVPDYFASTKIAEKSI